MNDNRQDNKDMLEDIIDDLSRENEFKVAGGEPPEPRRPKPASGGSKLWLGVAAGIVILAATWYVFTKTPEPVEVPAPPETPAAIEEAAEAAAPTETLFPPSAAAETAEEGGIEAAASETAASQPAAGPETLANAVNQVGGESSSEAPRLAEEEKARAEAAEREKKAAEARAEAEAKAKAAAEEKARAAKAEAEAKAAAEEREKQRAELAKAEAEAKLNAGKTTEADEKINAALAEAKAEEPAVADPPPAVESAAAPSAAEAGEAAPAAAPAPISNLWVVNISSTPDASESLKILTKVMASEAGGQVYAYETTVDGKQQHRIRVGFFASRAEAEAAGQALKEAHKLSAAPWAVQPTEEEVTRYKKKP